MSRRLLLTLALVCAAVSSFAYNVGDYIFTPSSRLKVVDANMLANGSFASGTTGWHGSDGTSAVNAEYWSVEEGAGPSGENVLQSLNGGAELDNYIYQTVALTAGNIYVVSFQVKGAAATGTATTVGTANYVDAYVNGDGSISKTADGFRQVFTATDNVITASWDAISDTIQANEDCFLTIAVGRLDAGTQVTGFSVHPVTVVYDTRIAQARVDYDKALLARPEFSVRDETFEETVAALDEALQTGDGSAVGVDFDDASSAEDFMNSFAELETAFLDANSYDLIAGGVVTGPGLWKNKLQKGDGTYGDWYVAGSGRWFHDPATSNFIRDYFPSSYTLNEGKAEIRKTLPAGKYFFQIEAKGYTYQSGKTNGDGYGNYTVIDYSVPVTNRIYIGNDTTAADTLSARDFKTYFVIADVPEPATVTETNLIAGVIHPQYSKGGHFFYQNPVLRLISPTAEADITKFNQDNLKAVQLEAAKVMIDSANVVLPKTEYPWGKTTLQAAIDAQTALYNTLDATASTELLTVLDADGQPVLDENNNATTKTVADSLTQVMRDMRTAIQAYYTENAALTNLVAEVADAQAKYDDPANAAAAASYRSTLKSLLDQANATINTFYAQTDSLPGDLANSNAQIAALQAAVENFTASTASYANPSEIEIANGAMNGTTGWDTTGSQTDNGRWRSGANTAFADGYYLYVSRGAQSHSRNAAKQKVTLTHAGAYEFTFQYYGYNRTAAYDNGVTADHGCRYFVKEDASADSIGVIKLHTYYGNVTGDWTQLPIDSLGYGGTTPEYFVVTYNKTDDTPTVIEFGLDNTANGLNDGESGTSRWYNGSNLYGIGSNHVRYYGDFDRYKADVLSTLQAEITKAQDALAANPSQTGDSSLYVNGEKALQNAVLAAQSAVDGTTLAYPISSTDKAPFLMSYVGYVVPEETTAAKRRVQTASPDAEKAALESKAMLHLQRAETAFQTLVTGIQGVRVADGSADVKSARNGVYNIAGQRVANSADGLAKGLYIVNGKKVIVK